MPDFYHLTGGNGGLGDWFLWGVHMEAGKMWHLFGSIFGRAALDSCRLLANLICDVTSTLEGVWPHLYPVFFSWDILFSNFS